MKDDADMPISLGAARRAPHPRAVVPAGANRAQPPIGPM
jgi:hypothetical protein